MKSESQENQKSEKAAAARKTKTAPTKKTAANKDFSSELNAPHWSVVSFETCLASGLTYDTAVKKMKQFVAKKVSGLCIVTDESAERIKS
jgi:hypothetical protein